MSKHELRDGWRDASWEEMAQQNPLAAVMTTEEMVDAPSDAFTPEQLEEFFTKGRREVKRHLVPLLRNLPAPPQQLRVVDYGCGAGRLLRTVAGLGYRAVGIDISPTMIKHCARLVPKAEALHVLDADGRCAMVSETADLVYSYAVVQHISRLSRYITAFDEMCRVLKPGGVLAVQVVTDDFLSGDLGKPARTENYEDHSLHVPIEGEPYRREQDNWGGVHIGHDRLTSLLADRGVSIDRWYFHKLSRLRPVWVVGRKGA